MGIDAGAWDKFSAPVLFLTGTRDFGPGQRAAAWRHEAFDGISTVDEYMVTLNGATHMTFSNGDRLNEDHKHHIEMIEAITTAWFDAQLKGDQKARDWLKTFAMAKHGDCVAEFKPAKGK
jgi:hypothetical protein